MSCVVCRVLCLLFFFFFKQKTAYEMRISDWSSDVCSSDLFLVGVRQRARQRTRGRRVDPALELLGVDAIRDLIGADTATLEQGEDLRVGKTRGVQIGRASCRERVCQYGVDLGGRRIIKKTKKKTHTINKHQK